MNRNARRAAAIMLLAAGAVLPALAASPAVQEAQTLLSQGDYKGALDRLDRYLASSPQDAEARFSRGLVLVKLNRSDEAIKVFADLTRDYPQLPEPYNNLAVLYAQKGDYEKARDALEAALATHPAYATAHENLGDIYSALAGSAYNRALQLDQGNQAVRYKLSLINQLGNGPGGYAPAGTTGIVPGKPKTDILAPAPVAAAPAPAPAPTPAPPVAAAPADTDTGAVVDALNAWAAAWAAKDVDGYLASYGADFKPESGSRAQWEAQRRERVAKAAHISVHALSPQVSRIDAHHVRVNFIQDYASDTVNDKVKKTVEMSNSSGSWKIVRESIR
ncbi:tetratricopeptide repeat protein [Nevskia soli]|uniref:tetratricopeptide repeat protein n=1 Tax=Nevskia soli TaxID=418856 RepID=UPI000AD1AFF4|nr:tetratricopeptide repeat protein [Nevskia soli]